MRPAGSLFFPLDRQLGLAAEGYSPSILKKVVWSATHGESFQVASEGMLEVGGITISAREVAKITARFGQEWAQQRKKEVQQYKDGLLSRRHKAAPAVACVELDAGRTQTRAEDAPPGIHDPKWQADNVACCMTLASKEHRSDPKPEVPKCYTDPKRVPEIVAQIKALHGPGNQATKPPPGEKKTEHAQRRRPKKRRGERPEVLVRTAVGTMQNVETFGWLMAAEVHQRGLDLARRKGCVCDGQPSNWTLFDLHLLPSGFIGILDFVHLLTYIFAAAMAPGGNQQAAFGRYVEWIRLAWLGKVDPLLGRMDRVLNNIPSTQPFRRKPLEDACRYIRNNRQRMNYPEYRRLGLPVVSAHVESLIKQFNKRMKGSEKFWLPSNADAMLQARGAYLSNDDTRERFFTLKRPHRRAVNPGGKLRNAA